ncbi:MAG: hypothetical protein LQ340_003253 [Diploschistes diacapsis]|nr:MAG: hypothetical protein LQ340_003253 [Diploschistes diacapsis]
MSPSLVSTKSVLFAVSASLFLSASAQYEGGTCYFPAGNIAENNMPCNPEAAVSSCCADQSHCLANGLCLVNQDNDTVEFARGACTDPTFQDPACFQHCHGFHVTYLAPEPAQPGSPDTNGAAVFECGSVGYLQPANYCCENGIDAKVACCSTSSLVFSLGPGTYSTMGPSPTSSIVQNPNTGTATDTVTVMDTGVVPSSTATLAGGDTTVIFSSAGSSSTGATAGPSSGGGSGSVVTAGSGVTTQPQTTSASANATGTSTGLVTQPSAAAGKMRVAMGPGLGAAILAVAAVL